MRVLTGVPALVAVVAVLTFGPLPLVAVLITVAGAWGFWEYTNLFARNQSPALPIPTVVLLGALPGLGAWFLGPQGLSTGLFASVLVIGLLLLPRSLEGSSRVREDLGVLIAGLVLVPWAMGHAVLLVERPGGRFLLAFLLVVLVANDTLAYLTGNLLGRTPLMPAVSPKKTVEGSLGGLAGGVLAGVLAGMSPGALPSGLATPALVAMGVALAAAGQAGDLLESKLKRMNNVKDSGRFLPGHGGLLDRLDAFLLAVPLLYYFWILVG